MSGGKAAVLPPQPKRGIDRFDSPHRRFAWFDNVLQHTCALPNVLSRLIVSYAKASIVYYTSTLR